MAWEKPTFSNYQKVIDDLKEATKIACERDLEKLKQLQRVFEAQAPKETPIGLEEDTSSSAGI